VVYDGAILMKKSPFKQIFFNKEEEQELGMLAMLPNWTKDIAKGTTIYELASWVQQVLDRQKDCITRFSDYIQSYTSRKYAAAQQLVDKVRVTFDY